MSERNDKKNDDAEDVLLLAKLIGIEPDEAEYFWIAKEAYNSDLPGGWEIFFDADGKPFYFDSSTKATTYEHPSIDFFRVLYRDLKQKDQEERQRQEEQELFFARPDANFSKIESTDDTRNSTGIDSESIEQNSRAKLLLAFSDDPSLAAKYREEVKEHEARMNEILKAAMRKEEDAFMRRMKLYITSKNDNIVRPLEQRIQEYGTAQNAKLDGVLQTMVSMLQGQLGTLGTSTQKGPVAPARLQNRPTTQLKESAAQLAAEKQRT
jgi:hypothetical protein